MRGCPGSGTARYVDSSVGRLQVRTIGADRQRHLLTCNGHPIPMLATDNPDVMMQMTERVRQKAMGVEAVEAGFSPADEKPIDLE